MTAEEHAQFLTLFEQSGLQSKARFIASHILNHEFRMVKEDRSTMDYVTKLSSFYASFRAIGVNYNQVVKELHSNFSKKSTCSVV